MSEVPLYAAPLAGNGPPGAANPEGAYRGSRATKFYAPIRARPSCSPPPAAAALEGYFAHEKQHPLELFGRDYA